MRGKSLVISAPTSAGKMLIAELTAIRSVLRKKRVLIIMPFVSAVEETAAKFRFLLSGQPVNIGSFTGCNSIDGNFSSKDIAICTIEKAYSLLSGDLVRKKKYGFSLVIVDELHMIGEDRGPVLELLLMKILYINNNFEKSIQLLGMSATLPNGQELANWLNAEYYVTDFRPVELKEMLWVAPYLYDKKLKKIPQSFETVDGNPVRYICYDRILNGQSVLIFCPTRAECKNLATTLANDMPAQAQCLEVETLEKVRQKLRKNEVDKDEERIILKGVGYHHAGLSFECRKILQEAFENKHLKVLVATTTLSMGVNLPAHLVIVMSPHNGIGCRLRARTYKQMVGRAGRKGLVENFGESILICEKSEEGEGRKLFTSRLEPAHSLLCSGNRHQEIALRKGLIDCLDFISHDEVVTDQEFKSYFSSSFYCKANDIQRDFRCAAYYLQSNHFIKLNSTKEEVSSTEQEFSVLPLGLATWCSQISPELALKVQMELKKIEDHSHPRLEFAIYVVIKIMCQMCYSDMVKLKWNKDIFEPPEEMKKVLFSMRADRDVWSVSAYSLLYEIAKRKMSFDDIVENYPITPLQLRDLRNEFQKYVSVLIKFSKKFDWTNHFVNKLRKCKDQISKCKKTSTSSVLDTEKRKRARSPSPKSDETLIPPRKKMRTETEPTIKDKTPTLRQLRLLKFQTEEIRIINEAVCKWKTIGDLLDFDDSGSRVSSVEERMTPPEDALREYFKLWLRVRAIITNLLRGKN